MSAVRHLPERERGAALVVVLWILTLLTTVAASYSYTVRAEIQMTRNRVGVEQAKLLAEEGINRAVLDLLRPEESRVWRDGVGPVAVEIGHAKVTVSVRDCAGLVDLNAAAPEVLQRLLSGFVAEPAQRDRLVDALLDWRDKDELVRLQGAEEREYLATHRSAGPKNGPFEYVEELGSVLGFTPRLVEELSPYVTIHSGLPGINAKYAPASLLRLFSAVELVSVAGEEAESGREAATRTLFVEQESGVFEVLATARLSDGANATVQAMVRLGSAELIGFQVMSWRVVPTVLQEES